MHREASHTSISALCGLATRRTEDSLDERLALVAACRELGARVAPATIGRFTITRVLGRGGQGCLYEGFDAELQRSVALKIPRYAHGDAHADLTFEARALALLRHPNLVTVYALEHCEGRPVVVMELVVGTPLSKWVDTAVPSTARILEVVAKVGDGLVELHRRGLTHRDVKPANILVDGSGQPRLVDLGLAAWSGEHTRGAGTPSYAAPEQLHGGAADPAADQFGLAATLVAVLGDAARARLPRRVRAAITKALATDPALRHRDVATFVRTLRAGPRRRRIAAGLTMGAGLGAALAFVAMPGPAPECERDASTLQRQVEARRTAIGEHLAALPTSNGPEAVGPTAAALDRYAMRWAEATSLVCSAPGGAAWQGPRAQCLDDGAFELTTVLAELTTLDAHTASIAPRMAGALPSPERCVDSELERLPPVLDHADELALRRELSIADRRCRHGLSDDCEAQLAALAERARSESIDACVWQPALAFTRASSAQYRGQPEQVADMLREAQWSAQRCGDDELLLDAHRILAEQLALAGDIEAAQDELRAAEATLDRMGRPVSQEIAVLASRAAASLATGEPRHAAEAAERALELHADLRGGAPEERAQLLGLLSGALHELGAGDRARALQEESLALREQQLGAHHPAVAHALANLAVGYGDVDLAKARALNRRAVDILAAAPDGHELELAMCLTHQSGYDLDAGDVAAARIANDRALASFAAAGAAEHPFAADALVVRAQLQRRGGALDEALATAARAVELLERTRGAEDATTVAAQRELDRVRAARDEHGGGA